MLNSTSRDVRRAVALVLATAVAAPAAWGDTGPQLEEIVVTAQKREETLREVPISVNAISGDRIADVGIVRLDDLKAYVPNLQVTETGIANNFYIRGIGSGLNQGFEQSVSIFADGIYRGRGHQSRMPFLDLARVEVLRGPQPILFGKNAISGAVNLISALPTPEFEGSVRALYEFETNEAIGDVVLSGPFSETVGARLAVRYRETDGYVRNLTLNRDEPSREELSGRLTLTFTPYEDFDATLRIENGSFDVVGRQVEIFGELPSGPRLDPRQGPNFGQVVSPPPFWAGRTYSQILAGPPPFGFNQSQTVLNNTIDYQRSANGDTSNLDLEEYALTMNWSLSGMTLTSVTGYSKYDLDETCDCDFNGGVLFSAGITESYEQFSQELRFASDTDGRLSWIAGLFFQSYDLVETDYVHFPSNSWAVQLVNLQIPGAGAAIADTANPRRFTQDSTLYSAFAQVSYDLTEAWRLTVGARWTSEDKSGSRKTDLTRGVGGPSLPGPPSLTDVLYLNILGIERHSVAGERSENELSPLVNLQYRFGNGSMAYASYARGNKSGGYDARSNRAPPNGTFEYEPEQADSYELGVKWGIGARAEINAALFYTDYEDLQTSAFDGRLGFNVGNGSAEVRGVEVEGRWQATDRLYLGGSIAYLDFEWTKYDGQCYFNPPASLLSTRVPGNCNYDGFTNQLAPEITAVVYGEYRQPLGDSLQLRLGLDVVYTDEFITTLTLDPNSMQDSYAKLNARVALGPQTGRWELAFIGRNLTDENTISYSGDTPLAGSTFFARSYYGFKDPPRTLALEATLRF